jgi:hypothetical protein
MALFRGRGSKDFESRSGGIAEGKTVGAVGDGWIGFDEAGVKRLNASMALFPGRSKGGGGGTEDGAEKEGTAGARDSEREVLPSVGCDMGSKKTVMKRE